MIHYIFFHPPFSLSGDVDIQIIKSFRMVRQTAVFKQVLSPALLSAVFSSLCNLPMKNCYLPVTEIFQTSSTVKPLHNLLGGPKVRDQALTS
jgi:hypothetical protein